MQRPSIVICAITALVASAALSVSAFAATKTVTVGDIFFKPKTVTVSKGSTVKWVWKGQKQHNVTVQSGPVKFASPTQKTGSFSKKLKKKGTYKIICTVHGSVQSLTLKVK
jgi:plastocyanin